MLFSPFSETTITATPDVPSQLDCNSTRYSPLSFRDAIENCEAPNASLPRQPIS